MDLLIEKLDGSRYYLSQYKVLITDFEESAPSVTRNSKQLDQRNGNIDFGGWHTDKTINITGYYRADDMDEEETLREKLYALLSDPNGYYITQLKTTPDTAVERPGETSGGYYDKLTDYPSHKRFLVYTEAPEVELVGNVGGTLLYKLTAGFKTLKLPYGETPANDITIDSPYKDVPVNLLTGTSNKVTAESVPKGAFKASDAKIVSVSSGETYTYSIEIPSNNTVDLVVAINLYSKGVLVRTVGGNVIKSGQSGISTITLTIPDEIDSLLLAVSLTAANPNSATTIYKSGEKFELGTTASPWSPNPTDPEYNSWYYGLDSPYKDVPVNLLKGTSNDTTSGTIPNGGLVVPTNVQDIPVTPGQVFVARINITSPTNINLTVGVDVRSNGVFKKTFVGNTILAGKTGYSVVTFVMPPDIDTVRWWGPRATANAASATSVYWSEEKFEQGAVASLWSPNPTDPEYNSWYHSLTSNISIPYSGSVPCNQLEQGFAIEMTAKGASSSLSFKINDTELAYSGAVASGDVFLFTGFSYTKNGLSIVSKTNKAYFILQPDKPNRITCNVPGTVKILGFQNLYA